MLALALSFMADWFDPSCSDTQLVQSSRTEIMRPIPEGENRSDFARIEVLVAGTRSDDGAVLALMFASPDGFPNRPEQAIARARATISENRAHLQFSQIPSGNYAIVLIHDENNNQTLDTNFLGIPEEGVGVSNNPKKRLGPPRFEDAEFSVDRGTIKKRITVMYL